MEVDGGDGGEGSLDMASRGLGSVEDVGVGGGQTADAVLRAVLAGLPEGTARRSEATVREIIFSWDLYWKATNRTLWAILAVLIESYVIPNLLWAVVGVNKAGSDAVEVAHRGHRTRQSQT